MTSQWGGKDQNSGAFQNTSAESGFMASSGRSVRDIFGSLSKLVWLSWQWSGNGFVGSNALWLPHASRSVWSGSFEAESMCRRLGVLRSTLGMSYKSWSRDLTLVSVMWSQNVTTWQSTPNMAQRSAVSRPRGYKYSSLSAPLQSFFFVLCLAGLLFFLSFFNWLEVL